MLFDLSRLHRGAQHLDRTYEPAAFALEGEDFRLIAPVVLSGDVRRDEKKVHLTGRVTTTLECDCGRCLDPIAVPVSADVDLMYLPASANVGEAEREVREADFGVAYYKDDVIDLGELIREQFYLAMPMKPLCRPDCQGLCSMCGINKNRETCTCKAEWVDPRLAPLKLLRRDEP